MFRFGRAVVVALSVVAVSQLVSRSALAQDASAPASAPSAVEASAPAGEQASAAPKAIGLADSGISTASPEPSGPPEAVIPFYPDRYPPPQARWKTLGLGVGLVAVGYGIAVGTSYLWDGAPGMQSLRTPVIGSVGAIAGSKCGADEGVNCSTVTVVLRAVLAGISGLAQIGGIGVLTEGVLMKTQEQPAPSAQAPKWYALPTASKSGAGVSVGVTF